MTAGRLVARDGAVAGRLRPHGPRFTKGLGFVVAAAGDGEAEETEAIVADQTARRMSDADMRLDPAERRLPAAMPLHAITSVHSEVGLRERLLMEIERSPTPIAAQPRTRWRWRGRPAAART